MRTLLLLLALALTATSHATVLVYKGVCASRTPDAISQYGRAPRLYFVVDTATRDSFPLFFFTLNGVRSKQGVPFALNPTHYCSSTPPNGKTLGGFSFLYDDAGAGSFSNVAIHFRGRQTTVQTGNSSTGQFPRTLSGTFRAHSSSLGFGTINELNVVLTLDAFHTQSANNGAKSAQETYMDLTAELATKGY